MLASQPGFVHREHSTARATAFPGHFSTLRHKAGERGQLADSNVWFDLHGVSVEETRGEHLAAGWFS